MKSSVAILPPFDAEFVRTEADADLVRRERYLRARLAEGGFTPPRLRLIAAELREVQGKIAERKA